MSEERNLLAEWAGVLLEAFAGAGVRHIVCSPGSRSAPFVLAAAALAERGALSLHDVIDERAAAFHALGIARTTGEPALVLCTSGTAGAHYLPAVIEAAHSRTPLLVMTADRPFELQGCAAPQTIDQLKLFGDHARAFFELGMPDASDGALRALRRIAVQSVATARGPLPGAVHLNVRARTPLEPPPAVEWTGAERALAERARLLTATPLPRLFAPRLLPDERGLDELVEACRRSRRGVLLAGPAPVAQAHARTELLALSAATGFPLLPEAASQLRFAPRADGAVRCDGFDTFLGVRPVRDALAPDLVLQIGAPPTSSAIAAWLEAHPGAARWVLAPHGWNDPSGGPATHLRADVRETARALLARLAATGPGAAGGNELSARMARADAAAWEQIDAQLAHEAALAGARLGEASAVRVAVGRLARGSLLAVGNSLPLRDVDRFCRGGDLDVAVWSQRGVNGIDGLLAGAAGAARAGRPTTLLIGDVSALHDVGGLAAACDLPVPYVVVVLNNRGGRIFEQLPVAARPDLARHLPHLTTPHERSLEPAARLFGHRYAAARDAAALASILEDAQQRPGCTVVEIPVAPGSAAATARELAERMHLALARDPRLLAAEQP